MLLCLFMAVSLKWVWQLRHYSVAFCPCNNAVLVSSLGSDASSLPSLASSQSTWGTLRQSLKSLSVEFAVLSDKAAQQVQPPVLHPHHLLCRACPKLALGNKCCFADVLRADGKRMMLWKNSIFSWICCNRTEWVVFTFSFCSLDLSWQGTLFWCLHVSHRWPMMLTLWRTAKQFISIKAIKSISCFLMERHNKELYIYSRSRFT